MQEFQRGDGAAASHWKLTLSYSGSSFHGWQVQPGLVTVQGTLAAALAEITGVTVLPQGSGRTDAGVHALAQVASFSLPVTLPPSNLQRALNHRLPVSIRVIDAKIVPPDFHARHSARRKHYEYRIFERRLDGTPTERICSPFLAPFVWDCRWPVDLDPMQEAANMLLGTHDFTAMAAARREVSQRDDQESQEDQEDQEDQDLPAGGPTPLKTMYSASWSRSEGLLLFNICGSGFLHHMVRNLVGTLVDIGRGSLAATRLPAILASRNRSLAGPTAPASGLYLRSVEYADSGADCVTEVRQPKNAGAVASRPGASK